MNHSAEIPQEELLFVRIWALKINYFAKQVFVFYLFLFTINYSYSQNKGVDTSHILQEHLVSSPRMNQFAFGFNNIQFDSLHLIEYQNKTLADLLGHENAVFIKSYGLSSLASPSLRGSSSAQTVLLWNGLNLNNPANGQVDLSLIPVSLVNEVKIQKGGASAQWGSGAIGGSIYLNNSTPVFDKGFRYQISIGLGSFKSFSQSLKSSWSNRRFSSSIFLSRRNEQNNFKFLDIYQSNQGIRKLSHAENNQLCLISENYLKINNSQRISFFLWLQDVNRNIPPTLLQQKSTAIQGDKNVKLSSEWQIRNKKTTIFLRVGYFIENLIYEDSIFEIIDSNQSISTQFDFENRFILSANHKLNFGINQTFVEANGGGLEHGVNQNKSSIFLSYLNYFKNDRLKSNITLRQEMVDSKLMPLSFTIGSELRIFHNFKLKANVSKVFRLPSLNDLYWVPGGQKNLSPEKGFTQDFSIEHFLQLPSSQFITSFNIFNRNINDWIIWSPGLSYWSPQNLLKVWSRGFELFIEYNKNIDKIKLSTFFSANYVLTSNELSKLFFDNSLHKQLIYVPRFTCVSKIKAQYKQWAISYRHSFVSKRFTSTDNLQWLEPYNLGSIYGSVDFKLKNKSGHLSIQMQNIWSETYQSIMNRPTPKINFQTNITFNF